MPIMTNNKHELFAHPDYECARWRHRHGKPGQLSFVGSCTSGRWPSVIDDKFYANLAAMMDKGELNTVASELLEGIRRDDESRREQLETLSEGFELLRLVIETAAATSVSFSAALEGMSTLRHPLLREACSLIQANAVGEMLPAAVPVKVRNDRRPKSKSADMMGHNDGPALDGTNPFSSPPAASAGASYAGSPPARRRRSRRQFPHPPAAAGMRLLDRRLPGLLRRWVRLPLLALCPVLGRAPPGAAHAGNAIIQEEQERDAIEDAVEKGMSHNLIFWRTRPISAAAAMIISLFKSRLKIEDAWAMGSS